MLYGNLIFIKKTGGDGSKYPVTERDIKIGRSDNCLIRIYNPQIALEHCQLIIEDSGQATLRNLSNQTILNGKPLSHGDVTLGHGDIFKLGERLARWEYVPSSKFYKQLLSPTGRLVAVVMPQQRSSGDQTTPGTSASQVSVLKSTSLGKRRFSERVTSENSSAAKIRKSNGSELIHSGQGDLQKLLTGHNSFKTTKLLIKGTKIKERKSFSGIVSSKSSKGRVSGKHRKSTLPLWKINVMSPPGRKSSENKEPLTKSNRKSAKSEVKTLLNNTEKSQSAKLVQSSSKYENKTPQKTIQESRLSGESVKSSSKTIVKTPLKIKIESPSTFRERSARLTCSPNKSPPLRKPSLKLPSKPVFSTPKQKSNFSRLVRSESKLKSSSEKHSKFSKEGKTMNVILEKIDSTPRQSLLNKLRKSASQEKAKTPKTRLSEIVSESIIQMPIKTKEVCSAKENITFRNSLKNTLEKTPRRKSSVKTFKSLTQENGKTSRRNVILKIQGSLTQKQSKGSRVSVLEKVDPDSVAKSPSLIDLDCTPSPKKSKIIPHKSASGKRSKSVPAKSPKSFGKTKIPSLGNSQRRFSQNKTSLPAADKQFNSTLISVETSTLPKRGNISAVGSSRKLTGPLEEIVSPRGVRRTLSPSSSAERAAKKLKISCPKKPDKNKKAALLVLGKASRKQLAYQNVKVLLKQKILKKAIKQSTALSASDGKNITKTAGKLKKSTSKPKSKKIRKKNKVGESSILSKGSVIPDVSIVKSSTEDKARDGIPKNQKVPETSSPPLKLKTAETDSKHNSNSNFSRYVFSSESLTGEASSPSSSFEKSTENYLFNSNRRCSKRLSSKNDTGRPDFIELSPTALGLIPKNIELFKTPKDNKRRSSSLVTPKNVQTNGIIKSASTSKIGNRKSVRFSPKDVSVNSRFCSPSISEKTDFDFSSFHTPNITVDVFVSPLTGDKTNAFKKDLSDTKVTLLTQEISNSSSIINPNNNSVPRTCARKLLQSPQSKKKLSEIPSITLPLSATSTSKSLSSTKFKQLIPAENKSPRNDLSDLNGVTQLVPTSNIQKTPKNSLSDLKGVSRLLRTPKDIKRVKYNLTDDKVIKKLLQSPKVQKSPKNDLTDVRGVKKLLRTPKVQKGPRNDLSDIKGVKKLLQSPKVQKSPKNDLTDVRGVKKLLRTPKVQKSPRNDLSDVRGVKKLLQSPKVQKSPRNDLTDVRGVKKLLRTPKVQKSPRNDLSDVRGVKKLLQSPKVQKSPRNDLTDVRGVKKLLRTPKVQKSPRNDLSDVRGVKKLLQSPKVQKSPRNDLTDVRGVKKLLRTPKVQKSPKNDLTDVTGVKKLLTTPVGQKSPKNSLLDISGIGTLFESPNVQQLSVKETKLPFSQLEESLSECLMSHPGVKPLSISKSPKSDLKSRKTVPRITAIKDFRAIRGRRTIYSSPKGPKNDLPDVMGVRELFSRYKPISDYNVNLTGVSELFDFPKTEDVDQKVSKTVTSRYKKTIKGEGENTKTRTRKGRFKEATDVETERKRPPSKKSEAVKNLEEKKPVRRKAVENIKTSRPKKAAVVKKTQKMTKRETKSVEEKLQARTKIESSEDKIEIRSFRKRKILPENSGMSPPKLRKKVPTVEETSSMETKTSRKAISKFKTERTIRKKTSIKRIQEVSEKAKSDKDSTASSKVQSKTNIKTGTKKIQEVQSKRSQTSSKKNISSSAKKLSPRKTRSAKAETTVRKDSKTQSKGTNEKSVKSSPARKKVSPVVRRSARRK